MRSLRLSLPERRRRAAVLLRTLAAVRGGASKALHYGDRTPALVLLAPVKGGTNPFTRVLAARGTDGTVFDPDIFREELRAWSDELDGPVQLGWAPGFLGAQREKTTTELDDLIEDGRLVIDHPRVVLTQLAGAIEAGQHDAWFDDPRA